jgi:Mg2+ and Co2+ transporter CorA
MEDNLFMSKKAVEKYYNEITDQYHEMIENLKDLEEEVKNELVEPERVENLKSMIAPLKDNWERWTYMMFLLNEPQRKSKKAKYRNSNKKKLQNLNPNNSIEATLKENSEVLSTMKG